MDQSGGWRRNSARFAEREIKAVPCRLCRELGRLHVASIAWQKLEFYKPAKEASYTAVVPRTAFSLDSPLVPFGKSTLWGRVAQRQSARLGTKRSWCDFDAIEAGCGKTNNWRESRTALPVTRQLNFAGYDHDYPKNEIGLRSYDVLPAHRRGLRAVNDVKSGSQRHDRGSRQRRHTLWVNGSRRRNVREARTRHAPGDFTSPSSAPTSTHR
ncbi:hypothetical protein Bbelb_134720 [Branchiostoma belcheri]|nr:hypothetical protein Bbelb_134720 [Branchiostoma belcheri]